MSDFQVQAIGWVRGGRAEVEDGDWGSVFSRIELDEHQLGPAAFAGLDGCSHVEVSFVFDQVDPDAVCRARGALVAVRIGRSSGSSPSAPRTGRTESAAPCAT